MSSSDDPTPSVVTLDLERREARSLLVGLSTGVGFLEEALQHAQRADGIDWTQADAARRILDEWISLQRPLAEAIGESVDEGGYLPWQHGENALVPRGTGLVQSALERRLTLHLTPKELECILFALDRFLDAEGPPKTCKHGTGMTKRDRALQVLQGIERSLRTLKEESEIGGTVSR